MKKSIILITLVFAVIFVLGSCTTFKAEGLSVIHAQENQQVIGHFSKTVTIHKFLGTSGGANLLNLTSDATVDTVSEVVWNEISKQNGNGAINVKVEYSAGFLHLLANSFTWNLWAPARVKVSGDVIRTKDLASKSDTNAAVLEALALAE